MKKLKFFTFIMASLLFFTSTIPADAVKIAGIHNSDYMMVVTDNMGSGRIATVGVVAAATDYGVNFHIESLEVINQENKKYEVDLQMTANSHFLPNLGIEKIVLSGNYLAISYRNLDAAKEVITVFKVSPNGAEGVLIIEDSFSVSSTGYFQLYNNYLVLQGFKNDNDRFSTPKIAYIDLATDVHKINKLYGNDNYAYTNPYIYDNKIVAEKDGYFFVFDLATSRGSKLADKIGSESKWLTMRDNKLFYRAFFNNKKNIVALDLTTGENKIIYEFSEWDNLDWLDARGDYVAFVMQAAADLTRKKLYLYNLNTGYIYIANAERTSYNFGYPAISDKYFYWTSDELDGKYQIYYAPLDGLYNDKDFLSVFRVFMVNKDKAEKLKGKILLQVESKGEAWYIDAGSKNRTYSKGDTVWSENKDKQLMAFLGKPSDALQVMRKAGVGITNSDLEKIPIFVGEEGWGGGLDTDDDGLSDSFEHAVGTDIYNSDSDNDGYDDKIEISNNYNPLGAGELSTDKEYAQEHTGKIFLQVENRGEAWYVNPVNNKRYYLGRPYTAFLVMKQLGLGISNKDFDNLFN